MGKLLIALSASLLLLSCSENTTEQKMLTAVTIEKADECHLCGMIIEGFAGPKGAASHKTDEVVRKFCSTRDMFAYYLDPENKRNIAQMLVHDMSQVPWETPQDELFINAKEAYYVVGSSKRGAMGSTLASFAEKPVAVKFAAEFGGELLTFEQITLDKINDF